MLYPQHAQVGRMHAALGHCALCGRPLELHTCQEEDGAHLRISSVTFGFFTVAKRSAYANVLVSMGFTCQST